VFDFFIRKGLVQQTQKSIDRLNPAVNLHVPNDFPIPSIRVLRKHAPTVSTINSFEAEISRLNDSELKAKTVKFKEMYESGVRQEKQEYQKIRQNLRATSSALERENLGLQLEKAKENLKKTRKKVLDEILPEAFAVVREAGKRILAMRHFDVQMIGGVVLNSGAISEMTTGEGKTLVATLPAYLNALTAEGVHVVTVNDYLARRDREWMGPLYEFLGLSIGVIQHDMMPDQRRRAYACDITYGTNNEFGFDYLRDNMVNDASEMVQREHYFAVVDEVDSILIDEARTPLIISGPAEESTDKYYRAFNIGKQLKGRRITERDEIDAKYRNENLGEGYDYLADEKAKSISLTDGGEEKAAQLFGVANLHDMEMIEYRHHVLQSLRAKEFFSVDVDYVVKDGEVIIVDEFTGRLMPGRRWSDGLHQAVEAREGIKIARENQTLATITFQNYFRLYEKLAGMTGTAYTEANEFQQIYKLDTVVIPPNKKVQRKNFPDAIYKSQREKYTAVINEIEEFHKRGQPVLVGTISIEKSERIATMLKQRGITHQVLNAKYHEMEAQIIAQAGRYKGVTIATNMAGRGTDILLGGNAGYLAKNLAQQKLKGDENEEQKEVLVQKFLEQFRAQTKEEHDKVIDAGGLHVVGTERHESRRIDNQLRGRQGRQGDPGSSRFFVALDDDLMRLFASDKMVGMMEKLGMEEGQVLEHPFLSSALENAQKRVESHNFEIRKHLLEYDNVMNRQREVIYGMRREVLESSDIKEMILESMDGLVDILIQQYLGSEKEGKVWDAPGLLVYLESAFGFKPPTSPDDWKAMERKDIHNEIRDGILKLYEVKERSIGVERMRYLERMMMLHTIDSKWKDHLYAMDQLKEGVGLRSYGHRDPLLEYKREGFQMFQMMYEVIHQEVIEMIFKVQAVDPSARMRGVFSSLPRNYIHQEVTSLSDSARSRETISPALPLPGGIPASIKSVDTSPQRNDGPKVGRNDPCPCGSGKKHKKCCGQ
jgi:preprotein translocase subunit SecA